MKSLVLFLATFAVGAALALAIRAARHDPYAAPVAPASSGHTHTRALNSQPSTINTHCPICGMEVDPDLKPASYQGKLVGFGCAACPPKFAKDPDRYGPYALRNEVVP